MSALQVQQIQQFQATIRFKLPQCATWTQLCGCLATLHAFAALHIAHGHEAWHFLSAGDLVFVQAATTNNE